MRVVYLIFIALHGLIHLLGFSKAFGIAEVNELKMEISKSAGLLWLIVALLFLLSVVLLLINKQWVWAPAIIAVVLSQILIILSWQDAKFGTIANIIILVVTVLQFASWNFNYQVEKEIDNLLAAQAEVAEKSFITDQRMEDLPTSVATWLKQIGMVGKEEIRTARFKQRGQMRLEPDQKWTTAEANQTVTIGKPGFVWDVKMDMMPLINVVGKDLFKEGNAEMVIKLGALVPVVNEGNNEKVDQSTLQRFLLEVPWYPSAVLSPYITWEEIDEYSSKATMTYKGVTGSATYHFNEAGELEKVSAMRYKDTDEDSEPLECIGEVIETTTIDGINIPTKTNVSWMLEEGKFTWFKIELFDVQYNTVE